MSAPGPGSGLAEALERIGVGTVDTLTVRLRVPLTVEESRQGYVTPTRRKVREAFEEAYPGARVAVQVVQTISDEARRHPVACLLDVGVVA